MLTEELGRMIITAMAQHDLGRPAESQQALDEARATYGAATRLRLPLSIPGGASG